MNVDLKLCQENEKLKLVQIAEKNIPQDEILFVALKGAFKEYLFCTDKRVYIIKNGLMTGHLFGEGVFKIPYASITNVEVNFHLLSGYFEISAAGLENKKFSSITGQNSPQEQPNCISLFEKDDFINATEFIMDMIHKLKYDNEIYTKNLNNKSVPEQIKDYKELLDIGAITQDEFDRKKKELLG